MKMIRREYLKTMTIVSTGTAVVPDLLLNGAARTDNKGILKGFIVSDAHNLCLNLKVSSGFKLLLKYCP